MSVHVERRRDGGFDLWAGLEAERYRAWVDWVDDGDGQERMPRPRPSVVLSDEDANAIVVAVLRGPEGATGPPGMMGERGEPGPPGRDPLQPIGRR